MSWNPLIVKNITLCGPSKPKALLEFTSGTNVICGASDTGKSFIVELADFLLGNSSPLRDIPERIGYDRTRMCIETSDKFIFTLERSIEGGDYRCLEGLVTNIDPPQKGTILHAKHVHDRDDNLSGWLLSKIGLRGCRIRQKKTGDTRSLSFRDLARLIIIQENEIIKSGSPFWDGQYISQTAQYSVLKLLLTGVDDSALIPDVKVISMRNDTSAKVELIDQWINDLKTEIEHNGAGREEAGDQLLRLHDAIEVQHQYLQVMRESMESALLQRRELLEARDKLVARSDEIEDYMARFVLLMEHYKIDIERLSAIEESGSLFTHLDRVPCPLCGAMPDDQHLDQTCEGNITIVIEAARAEIQKIRKLSLELQETINDLKVEQNELHSKIKDIESKYRDIDCTIRDTISPRVGSNQAIFSDLVEKSGEIKRHLDLFSRLDRLENQKTDLIGETLPEEVAKDATYTDLSETVLDAFSKKVEELLTVWHFPGSNRVYFDKSAKDLVIDGKPRGSRGKGLRAITHAACSIALLEYCKEHNLPHPGFVILDSPLLAYWAPEGREDDLKGTDLKDRFYQYLASEHKDDQIIIIENEHPQQSLQGIAVTIFTKNPHQGRYGFFPIS